MRHALYCFVLLISFLLPLHAAELYLDEKSSYSLGKSVSYLEDYEASFCIGDVLDKPFTPVESDIPGFGFTPAIYWFKTTIIPNEQSRLKSWWLIAEYPLLDHVEVFEFVEGSDQPRSHAVQGRLHPMSQRQLDQRQFAFSVGPLDEPVTLYIRVKTSSSMQVPMRLVSSKHFFEQSQLTQLLLGLYYGVFLIIFLYNIIMYVYTRENDYLRYLLFLVSFIMWQLTLDGFGIQYLWSEWDWMIAHGGIFWISAGLLTSLLFGRYFLRTQEYAPRLDMFIMLLVIISGVMLVSSVFLPYATLIPIGASLSVVVPLLLWGTGIVVWRQLYRPARFYVLGWSAFLLGSVMLAMNKLNLVQGFYFLNHAQQIGSALEMIFLSWALADRVKLLQDEYVDKLSSLNQVLQKKVRTALEEARQKDKVMLNQSRLAALGEMIEQIAHQWRQPLNTMALLNQNLFIKHQLGKLESEDFKTTHEQMNENLQYMSRTIDDFRNMHQTQNEHEQFTIEEVIERVITLNDASLKFANILCQVHSSSEHQLDSYRNELIQILMNLVKNARDAIVGSGCKHGRIDIQVIDTGSSFQVSVEDNGGGIDPDVIDEIFNPYFTTKGEEQGSGIGLFMSKTIIEERLGGIIRVENTEVGARFTMVLPKEQVTEA
jgi:signal transduction histidine kinase